MKAKLSLVILFSVGIVYGLVAQQRAQFTQYMNNNYVLNPAAGGTEDYTDIKASYRNQWVGFPGAPVTYYLTAHTTIGKSVGKPHRGVVDRNYHTVGVNLYNDVTGPTGRGGFYASYGYNLRVSRMFRLSAATFLGVQQYRLNGDALTYHDAGDITGTQTNLVPDASVGLWLYSDQMYFGISTFQVLQNKLNYQSQIDAAVLKASKLSNHYYITAGFRIPINHDWHLVPSILIKYVSPAPVSIDLNTKFKYNDLFWMGISYRNLDSFAGLVGFTIASRVDIGYSYDATISKIRNYSYGSHEILVGLRLPNKKQSICPSDFW